MSESVRVLFTRSDPRSRRPGATRRLAVTWLGCGWLAWTSACAPHYEHLVERSVPASDELTCPGYMVWDHEPVRDVFLVVNGSGTLSNAFVHPTFEHALRTRSIAYLTYDKPGILAPFGDPAEVRRDFTLFEQYTLGHGLACATHALQWARAQFGDAARLHLRGHSEGALVALYAYDGLLDRDPGTGALIASVVLSGLPLEPFAEILEHQLATMPRGDRLRAALATCDDRVLAAGLGVTCAYVDDAASRPSGRAMFERLSVRAPAAQFHVFHGTHDWNTPVEPVRALEAWNASVGHLPMTFHYYPGGHAGSDAARAEMARVLEELISD